MNIKKIDKFFYPNCKVKKHFCRSCSNTFFSEIKYNNHIKFCQTNKAMISLPSKKIFRIQKFKEHNST